MLAGLLVAASVCLAPVHAQESRGTIEGVVQTADGETAPAGVNVSLDGTALGSTTGTDGRYVITGVPAGTYTLVVSYIGLQTQRREVEVEAGETVTVPPVTLQESTQELKEVVVEAGQRTPYSTEASSYVAKMPLEKVGNPQVYNSITDELLTDQVATNFEDVMTNAPGVFKLWESTGRGSDGAGFYSLRGFSAQPTMMNGLPALTNGSPDPANIKRVEILKGPSGTLYGSSLISYGGLINVVTKKPTGSFGGEVSYKTGSFGLNRITADVNAPIGGDEGMALRVNGAYHSTDSFQDAGFSRSAFLAPTLSYAPTDDLSFLVTTEFYTSEKTNPTMLFLNRYVQLSANSMDELAYDPERSYTDNDLTIRNPSFNLQGQMRYALSEGWTSETSVSRSSATSDGYYSYLWEGRSGTSTYTRFISDQNSTTLNTDLQQNLVGDVSLIGMEHQMVVGVDYRHQRIVDNGTGYVGFDQVQLGMSTPPGLSQTAVDTALASASNTNSVSEQATYSAYASDVVHVIPQLSLMGSLRVDHFDQEGDVSTDDDDFQQTAFSPKLGVVVKPIPGRLSLFGNYMNGFSNVEPRTQDDGSTRTFEPEHANQWEVGVKADAFNDRLTATLSYYDITVSNIVLEDPERANFYVQRGEKYSRGAEVSVTAVPVDGLNVTAGYSHNESEVTEGSPVYEGRRPEEAGPKNLVNAWVSYRVTSGGLEGVGIGLGGNYASENLVLNRATTGQFTLSSYTVLDASISYDTSDYRVDLKVNNLTDETYYKGWSTINPQTPRNVKASFSYKF